MSMLLSQANALTWELDLIPSLFNAMVPTIIHSLLHIILFLFC